MVVFHFNHLWAPPVVSFGILWRIIKVLAMIFPWKERKDETTLGNFESWLSKEISIWNQWYSIKVKKCLISSFPLFQNYCEQKVQKFSIEWIGMFQIRNVSVGYLFFQKVSNVSEPCWLGKNFHRKTSSLCSVKYAW